MIRTAVETFQGLVIEVRPVENEALAFARRWNAMVLAQEGEER